MYAIGVVETLSIPLGILAGDQMLKTADVSLISAQTVCAGKYIVVVSGEVAAVSAAVGAGVEGAAHGLVDSLVIPNVDLRVIRAMSGACDIQGVQAVGVVETITFVPMLGTGGSYLGFVTGNLTNLKVPAALNAMQAARVKPGTEEGDVISTIAIASSSIMTTVIIALGVFLLGSLRPVLESPVFKPAFDNILPAMFGALGVVFISKNPKIAMAPLLFMVVLFMLVPSLSGSVSVLVPLGALIAIGVARILYRKGKLGGAPAQKGSI